MEIIDGAALFGAGAVAFALKAYLHLANGVAHRARHLVASIVLYRLELVFRERVEHAGLMGKIRVNALHRECGYWVIRQPGRVALVRLTTLGKPDCFPLCLNQLTKPAYGAQPEHDDQQEQAHQRHPADGEQHSLVPGHSGRPYLPRMSRRMRSQRSLTAASAPREVGW